MEGCSWHPGGSSAGVPESVRLRVPLQELLKELLVLCISFGGSLSKRAPLGVKPVVMLELGTEPSCQSAGPAKLHETHSDNFLGCFQVGEARGSSRQVLLRGPQHPDHHVAAPHGRVRQELRAVAVAAQPAPGSHAAVQPKVLVPGESWACWWRGSHLAVLLVSLGAAWEPRSGGWRLLGCVGSVRAQSSAWMEPTNSSAACRGRGGVTGFL